MVAPDGQVLDAVKSYVGMRKVHIEGNKIYLNNEPYYQRLVLDQGFYPDGIWTAPSDDALRRDIELDWPPGSTARACIRRFSRNATITGPTDSATSPGAKAPAGEWMPTTWRRPATSSPNGPNAWSATGTTPRC